MPEGYGYTPEGIARYRKDQEQKRTLGSTDAPRITASPSPVRPRVQRKTDPNPLAHFVEMLGIEKIGKGGLGEELGRKSDVDVRRAKRRNKVLPR
jgi:hypothetical protein